MDLLIDRLVVDPAHDHRLKQSVNLALSLAQGQVAVEWVGGETKMYSMHSACPECGFSFPEIEPRFFSFNNPRGACPTCHGLGTQDIEEVESEVYTGKGEGPRMMKTTTWRVKNPKAVVEGDEDSEIDERALRVCAACNGTRLKPEALNVRLNGQNIAELSHLAIDDMLQFCRTLKLNERQTMIGQKIVEQISSRLHYLQRVGAGYLSLDRPTRTLSGGEAQRIRLASQVGSALVGVLYVLDEPSIGLHPRDHHRLLEILKEIRDLGNTVLMVEHDEETIREADYLIDLGPRAGRLGGDLIAVGTPTELAKNPHSLTGNYLSGRSKIEVPVSRRPATNGFLELKNATGNNL